MRKENHVSPFLLVIAKSPRVIMSMPIIMSLSSKSQARTSRSLIQAPSLAKYRLIL